MSVPRYPRDGRSETKKFKAYEKKKIEEKAQERSISEKISYEEALQKVTAERTIEPKRKNRKSRAQQKRDSKAGGNTKNFGPKGFEKITPGLPPFSGGSPGQGKKA